MEAKQSTLRDFDVLNKLGEGAFGQVFKVKRKVDGKEYALKKVHLHAILGEDWSNERKGKRKRAQRDPNPRFIQLRIYNWLQVSVLR